MRGGVAPDFWWKPPSLTSHAMAPLSWAYGAIAARRMRSSVAEEAGVPVLCVGNFTVGGGGKTPTAIALGTAAKSAGYVPGFVTRGHGRRDTSSTVLVNASRHSVAEVGDEPLLLAEIAPTAVSARRAAAARVLTEQRGVDFVIMDDGFQSARLAIDYACVTVDARRGLGNGAVLPAGPLRAPLSIQLPCADAVLIVGEGEAGDTVLRAAARANRSIYRATTIPSDRQLWRNRKIVAFAGIADPTKFYATLDALGADVVATREFPDHHNFTAKDIHELSALKETHQASLLTTRKDAVRLRTGTPDAKLLFEQCDILDIELQFDRTDVPSRIIRDTVQAFKRRRLKTLSV